ncbi:adenylate/guanylate cyclase domain-containing protein [Aurantimonas endophytica]|uniref:Adenylate cyclase n=1 Tax=Aurantimonas endophytica TaxID=1522175 RepID=A0A7W6HEI0_9HYPH|nr:adenylate/guanylate cyclase domain-containing protein [Aurantimonas endophytica]MBB4003698.1 adenylate cyclase [Aurantimonas endophytica]MCO6404554.1 adenylate/guanylate cyclase domain-containing protein [Aurantimonas endophytica]
MAKRSQLLAPFKGTSARRTIPDRVQDVVQQFDRRSEQLIGWVQLTLGSFLAILYLVAPRPTDGLMQQPVPVSLAIYLAFTGLRLFLSYRMRLPDWFLGFSILVDITLLFGLIWYFHIQYGQTASFYLRAPTVMYVFVFIAIRAFRFEPAWVLATGASAAVGWFLLTAYAIWASGPESITRSYVAYLQGNGILIGAEIDKIVAILLLTTVLAFALARAKQLLAVATREQIEREELRRFLPPDVERAITEAPLGIVAGAAEERDAAIIVLDIRGFSAFVNRSQPKEAVQTLVGLHRLIVPVVQRHGGVVDKYLGDGVLATFGATRPSPTAAADALHALVEIMAIAREWSTASELAGLSLRMNGAATAGKVVFAALGDEFRLEYTVIGDAVNLAAKLEKHNKAERTAALTTRETYALALAQGFSTEVPAELRSACLVQGVPGAIDIVVLDP